MTRNDVDGEVMPGCRAASRHDAPRWICNDEIGRGIELYFGKVPPEQVLVAPVRGRLAAIKQPGGCEQHRAGTSRVDRAAAFVAMAQPLFHARMAISDVISRGQP